MVRALQRSIFGRNCGASFCSIMVQRTPRFPRSIAMVRPVGPAPTMRTSVSVVTPFIPGTPRAKPYAGHSFASGDRHKSHNMGFVKPRTMGSSRNAGDGLGHDTGAKRHAVGGLLDALRIQSLGRD